VIDLNALRVFERVASLRSFSAAARSLGSPKSSVSRAVAQLEAVLGSRLFQRTTRTVALTDSGVALLDRCADILTRVDETVDYVGSFGGSPRGLLRISAGIGFGLNVLSELLPDFLLRYPKVDVALDLTSRSVDLVATSIDVAIRMGPLPDSELVATRLGTIQRHLCAAPSYLARRGTPRTPGALRSHDVIELPGTEGRPRRWTLAKPSGKPRIVELSPRITVNDALTIHRLVRNGAGVGGLSAYLCAADIEAGRLVHVLPGWRLPAVPVHVVFPSARELSPAVRAFVDFLRGASHPRAFWQADPLEEATSARVKGLAVKSSRRGATPSRKKR
jgi:LysR family transcriptional regulator, regulator for bpeEF and oprC